LLPGVLFALPITTFTANDSYCLFLQATIVLTEAGSGDFAVPEPFSVSLLLSGAGLLAVLQRRIRQPWCKPRVC